jgi:hypothetical protein
MTGRNPDGIKDLPFPGCSDVAYGLQRLNAIIGPSWTQSAALTTSASTSC